jgi:putative tricarboxylic transport membrane protein
MSNSELWGGAFWLALSILVIWQGLVHEVGTARNPETGFALFWTGLVMCGLSAAVLVAGLREGGASVASLWAGTRWPKVLMVIAALIAYTLLFETFGFLLATIPLMLILMRAVDPVRWTIAVPLSVGVPLGAWWVLKRLLLIQLPSGIFEIG